MTAAQRRTRRRVVGRAAVVLAVTAWAAATAGALLVRRPAVVVVAGLVLLVVLFVVERAATGALTAARAVWAAERDLVRAAGIDEAERTTAVWLTAVGASGSEPAAQDHVVGLWEWTCSDCRLGSDLVQSRDEAAFLAGEHDRTHHRARVSAHVHQVARLLFSLDPTQTPEVTAWPDAA